MPVYNKFDQFVEDKAHGVHNLGGDQLVVFLTNVLPVKTNAVLANITQIDYANLSSRNLTTNSSVQTDGTYKLTIADLVLTASGVVAPFRWVGVYNDTPTNPADPLIAWYDYGSEVNMQNGETFTCDFDQVNGFHTET